MEECKIPPVGWKCSRGAGHEGPCAALPDWKRHQVTLEPKYKMVSARVFFRKGKVVREYIFLDSGPKFRNGHVSKEAKVTWTAGEDWSSQEPLFSATHVFLDHPSSVADEYELAVEITTKQVQKAFDEHYKLT